ncbi:hypothetical protein P7228_07195 [Altererythrobacter arenosus]|uniref:Uncharacterized protein n=1 Tax=Altererythrobacter arenosus TaxID=3032592 RepID=A0ABY8FZN0_9SPHN|nr:hypothetical protein [Altererythrobacter sp. CAU 1644]WFL78841.1 hypothetical protein P7228_07195 [Altererythrobacter sp. CAU 1644]
MIRARLALASRALQSRMATKLVGLAEARSASLRRAAKQDGSHWRDARLLWPLFGREH